MSQRFVVLGAGAIGGGIGGMLHSAGFEVILIARGDHAAVLQERGLDLRTPRDASVLPIPTVTHPSQIEWRDSDIIINATKLQDCAVALDSVRRCTPLNLLVVATQNGLDGEPMAARRGFTPVGALVWVPATHLDPGSVLLHGAPIVGILDVGAWPAGTSPAVESIAAAFRKAGFDSQARDDIMAWKRTKLLTNLAGELVAVIDAPAPDLIEILTAEAIAVYEAANLRALPLDEVIARVEHLTLGLIDGVERPGGSAWQSFTRGRSPEVDFQCGEIVLLGMQYGVPTPLNRALQTLIQEMAVSGAAPCSVNPDRLRL